MPSVAVICKSAAVPRERETDESKWMLLAKERTASFSTIPVVSKIS